MRNPLRFLLSLRFERNSRRTFGWRVASDSGRNRRSRLGWRRRRFVDRVDAFLADSMMDFRKSANGGEVFGGEFENVFELFPCVLKAADLNQRPAERDVSG